LKYVIDLRIEEESIGCLHSKINITSLLLKAISLSFISRSTQLGNLFIAIGKDELSKKWRHRIFLSTPGAGIA
jgi:hypothetical protein